MRVQELPHGVRLLSWATAVRWFGWGLFEALLPVFLFSFSNTYAETGLLSSVYHIVFLLSLPIAGLLADRVASRTIILIGLLLYPFLSVSYFWAGVTGAALFVVIARALNGAGYAFDAVGRTTYVRAHTPTRAISTAFGYFDTITNFWWIVAVLASLLIIPFVQLSWLFLAIIPTVLVTITMVFRLVPDHKERLKDGFRKAFSTGFYPAMLKEIRSWNKGMRLLATLAFFSGFVATIAEFLIPIYSYTQGSSLRQVILITVLLSVPAVFGTPLGKIADKKKSACIFAGLSMTFFLLILLALMKTYAWQLIVAFGLGLVRELLELADAGISTHLTHPHHYGRMSSAMEGIGEIGTLAGPVLLGLLIDKTSMPYMLLAMAGVTLIMLAVCVASRRSLQNTTS